ncbi:MAG: peptide chain release factor N(5)-glutamine methyltransferase [Gammaproteobacteria bacterium]|nr:peptide chain release factor N(5)-glutamine methyltransferase [Gammaproteobacteria bacterium]
MKPAALNPSIVTVVAALRKALHDLKLTSPTPCLDAEVLVMHVCGLDRRHLITRDQMALTGDQQLKLERLLERRKQGEPVAYLIGMREFWSMELYVSPATLIPRPETELLVEKALEQIPLAAECTIADLGTGSGAIALALAKERPRCRVIATDISPMALKVANTNGKISGLTHIEFQVGDWFAPLAGETLDIIVSNPPYVRADDVHLQQGDVRFEPAIALVSGKDGLEAIRRLAENAWKFLRPNGWLMFEHGLDQAGAIEELLHHHGYRDIVFHQDLAGHTRVATCHR